jgi:hypothetical protein
MRKICYCTQSARNGFSALLCSPSDKNRAEEASCHVTDLVTWSVRNLSFDRTIYKAYYKTGFTRLHLLSRCWGVIITFTFLLCTQCTCVHLLAIFLFQSEFIDLFLDWNIDCRLECVSYGGIQGNVSNLACTIGFRRYKTTDIFTLTFTTIPLFVST